MQEILKMDKNTVIRHLLSKSIHNFKIETALDKYRKGKVSLGNAAKLANLNLWEFIEICGKKRIQLDLSEQETELGIKIVNNLDLTSIYSFFPYLFNFKSEQKK
ncbi:MAG: hypothetical protein BAJALOKI1v1_90022 [Promethearchaeota archaeon]|nr:MAG: hypothetical protein BAJALOKI1v1_90022 [Candidatus Lokiarchaeota archaeon]